MIHKDCVVSCEHHIGEIVFVFCDCRGISANAFTPLWCALAPEEASVGVLLSGLDGFSLDGLNYAVDGYVLATFVLPRGFN